MKPHCRITTKLTLYWEVFETNFETMFETKPFDQAEKDKTELPPFHWMIEGKALSYSDYRLAAPPNMLFETAPVKMFETKFKTCKVYHIKCSWLRSQEYHMEEESLWFVQHSKWQRKHHITRLICTLFETYFISFGLGSWHLLQPI